MSTLEEFNRTKATRHVTGVVVMLAGSGVALCGHFLAIDPLLWIGILVGVMGLVLVLIARTLQPPYEVLPKSEDTVQKPKRLEL